MTNFTRDEFNAEMIERCARNGVSIPYKIRGFWSRDCISVSVSYDFFLKAIEYKISCSSGGRDFKEVPEDCDAYTYKAEALLDAAQLVRTMKSAEPEILRLREIYMEEARVKAEKEREAILAAEAADPLITETVAKILTKSARELTKSGEKAKVVFDVRQPAKKFVAGRIIFTEDRITIAGKRSSLKDVVTYLCKYMSISSANEAREAMFKNV